MPANEYATEHAVFPTNMERPLIAAFFTSQKGTFVEVGAYDAVYQSQSYQLELQGWDGVLIEPLAEQAENLRRSRRGAVVERACVSPDEVASGVLPMLDRRSASSLRFDVRKAGPQDIIQVPVATLTGILDELGVSEIDFLSVDVCGTEPNVLRGLDFTRFKPSLVLVDDKERFGETCSIMRRNRYRLVRRSGHNGWFVPRGYNFPLTLRGRVELLWTYGLGRLVRRVRNRFHAHPA